MAHPEGFVKYTIAKTIAYSDNLSPRDRWLGVLVTTLVTGCRRARGPLRGLAVPKSIRSAGVPPAPS
jgi:hypothetical protein